MTAKTAFGVGRARLLVFALSSSVASVALLARAENGGARESVEIRRTSYGIPHIRAADEKALGYGIGYVYAEDNLCLLAEEIATVNGERSKFLGGEGTAPGAVSNLESDFYFRWLNDEATIADILASQTAEVRALLSGYASGYNRYLRDIGAGGLPSACRDKGWVRPISDADLVKNMRRLVVQTGLGRFVKAIVAAAPPARSDPAKSRSGAITDGAESFAFEPGDVFQSSHGSNALALGKASTRNGRGLLLANPHYPWSGALRFYQMHLTIPGKLDVMGASLPGLPMINIGFSKDLAWTHTVDASSHFVSYRLRLDPTDPTRYLQDGESLPMTRSLVTVEVREKDGSVTQRSHAFYQSKLGPVFASSDKFRWDEGQAFVIDDANFRNDRALRQWYSMNRATSLDELQSSITGILGIPWVDTVAVDSAGTTLFMNVSAIPDVDTRKLSDCGSQGTDVTAAVEFPILDGTRRACERSRATGAGQDGLVPGASLPILKRDDYVINSNDSAWLANPARPLTGFSPFVSREKIELGARARSSLDWLRSRLQNATSRDHGLEPADLQRFLMRNQVYVASLVLDDLLTLCPDRTQTEARSVSSDELAIACDKLRSWNRTADLDANIGYVYFEGFMERVRKIANAWRIPFDPSRPVDTPRGLNIDVPDIAEKLKAALVAAAQEATRAGFSPDASWGDIQVASRRGRAIPIHGGSGALGVYNVIRSMPSGNSRREVVSGSSYVQVVAFEPSGPRAETVLAFSESLDPDSPYFADQTELFSRKEWVRVPFSDSEIEADPAFRRQTLRF